MKFRLNSSWCFFLKIISPLSSCSLIQNLLSKFIAYIYLFSRLFSNKSKNLSILSIFSLWNSSILELNSFSRFERSSSNFDVADSFLFLGSFLVPPGRLLRRELLGLPWLVGDDGPSVDILVVLSSVSNGFAEGFVPKAKSNSSLRRKSFRSVPVPASIISFHFFLSCCIYSKPECLKF